jgi:hypothetical protein
MSFVATCAVEEKTGTCGAPTQAFLCGKHTDELLFWLWDIGGVSLNDSGEYSASLLDELDTTICGDDKVGGASIGIVVHSTDHSISFNERASDAKSALCNTVVGWTKLFAEDNPHLIFDVSTIEQAARWMAGFPNLLAGHPAAVEMHDELRLRVRDARRAIDRPADVVHVGECGGWNEVENKKCTVNLFAVLGHIEVTCRACETTFCVGDRQRDLLLKLRTQVVTARQAEKALKPFFGRMLNVKTLRTWINRQVIKNRAKEGEEPKVLVADVLDLLNGRGSAGVSSCAEAA